MGKHEYYELDKINDVDDYVIADFFEDNNRSVVKLQNKICIRRSLSLILILPIAHLSFLLMLIVMG